MDEKVVAEFRDWLARQLVAARRDMEIIDGDPFGHTLLRNRGLLLVEVIEEFDRCIAYRHGHVKTVVD